MLHRPQIREELEFVLKSIMRPQILLRNRKFPKTHVGVEIVLMENLARLIAMCFCV